MTALCSGIPVDRDHVSGIVVFLGLAGHGPTLARLAVPPTAMTIAHESRRVALVVETGDEQGLADCVNSLSLMTGIQAASIAFHSIDLQNDEVHHAVIAP